MRAIKCLIVAALILSVFTATGTGRSEPVVYNDEATTCDVLKRLAQSSRNWSEVIAYKNAFDFVKARVGTKSQAADDYFRALAEQNKQTRKVVCMYVNKGPQENCYFRNMEADVVLEVIDRKLKEDNLSTQDIIDAIEKAKPAKNPKIFIP